MENRRDPRSSWIKCSEPASDSIYYFNVESNSLSWSIPSSEKCIQVKGKNLPIKLHISL